MEPGALDVLPQGDRSTAAWRCFVNARRVVYRARSRLDPSVGAIEADQRKVKQVLFNLLSNAVKFTPEGEGSRSAAPRRRTSLRSRCRTPASGSRPKTRAAFSKSSLRRHPEKVQRRAPVSAHDREEVRRAARRAIALESAVASKHLHVLTATARATAAPPTPAVSGSNSGHGFSRASSTSSWIRSDPTVRPAPSRTGGRSPHCAAYGDRRRIDTNR